VTFLFDTNACAAVINGRPPHVRDRFRQMRRNSEIGLVSTITLFELWFGIEKSTKQAYNAVQLQSFLPAVQILPFEEEDARVAGRVRLKLMRSGTPIGSYDLLIASQALRHDLIVVTANAREFSSVPDLRWENWER
jgi:tRNA(fMet)-specific endonuclease VapC